MRWIRLWIKETIMGSTFQELNSLERGVWFSLLVMSADGLTPGIVEIRKGVPWKLPALASYINVAEDDLRSSLDKLKQVNKVEILPDGRIAVVNFNKYQTRYEKYYKADHVAYPVAYNEACICTADKKKNRSEVETEEERKKKRRIEFDFTSGRFLNITEEIKKKWAEAYPAVDIGGFIKQMEVWQAANPKNRKTNYERAFANWLSRQQDRARAQGNDKADDLKAFEERQKKALGRK